MSYQHWGFYLCLIWSHKHSLDVSNQNRISMALKISKHSFRKFSIWFLVNELSFKWLKAWYRQFVDNMPLLSNAHGRGLGVSFEMPHFKDITLHSIGPQFFICIGARSYLGQLNFVTGTCNSIKDTNILVLLLCIFFLITNN